MDLLRCNSCGVAFEDMEGQKAHYRTELHRYNLKRRTNDLGPVSETEFLRRKAAALSLAGQSTGQGESFHAKCNPCNRSFSSKATLEQHLQSRKHQLAAAAAAATGGDTVSSLSNNKKQEKKTSATTTTTANNDTQAATLLTESLAKVAVAENEAEENEQAATQAPPPVDLRPETCIFCNEHCPDLETAVIHMWKKHGFHIPDGEYLVDLRGLLRYCAEKVKIGCICLYCNGKGKKGAFETARDAQRHMSAKSHCKLLYVEGEDLHEFRPFYDFSASYASASLSMRGEKGKGGGGKEGEEEVDDDDLSLETVDSDYEEEEGMDVDDEHDDVEGLLRKDAMYVSEIGELVLPDGRSLGRREYARYYKQRYRPEETSEAMIACQLETAERMGGSVSEALVGVGGGGVGGRSLMMKNGEVGRMWGPDKAARRAVMKVTKAVQRARMKYDLRKEIATNKFHKRPQIDG